MHRYLLNYSYIGTYFRGVQKNVPKSDRYIVDQSTVQGVIELALGRFNNHDPPAVSISSRTDTGVHALNTTCHFDLPKIYNCHYITVCLNSFFRKENDLIRAIRTRLVPPTFHCRFNALSRTYVYRLAILKQEYSLNNYRPTILQYFVETPIEEQNRCIFIPNPKFDVEAFRKAAKLFEGYHDFRTFMTTLSKGSPPVHTLRYIHEVSIEKSTSTSLPFNNASNYFDYWDIKFKGKSFLYRQQLAV
ncbi:tRNA pseudouridine synthase-like 1 [Ctenocephalides felis]|uniref:tRNA pseudouridine synthase-like 1 n=1 Tax=Ctenocephalides felis TaxID=7515 RepID=UPI000E6E1272|nr:tRNA pseudouridine synthase-like 1 [Ctenocephalides felis]